MFASIPVCMGVPEDETDVEPNSFSHLAPAPAMAQLIAALFKFLRIAFASKFWVSSKLSRNIYISTATRF